jgi:hypothetical protein
MKLLLDSIWYEEVGRDSSVGVCQKENILIYTVVPHYPLIQCPWLQLSAVYRGPKKIGEL